MSEFIRTAVVSVAVAALILVLAELVLRLAGVQPQPWPSAGGKQFPQQILSDPLLGPLPRPGYSGEWYEFLVSYDENGFRDSGLPPLSNAKDLIAFTGDSCTFGWGLDTPDTFIAKLDQLQRQRQGPRQYRLLNGGYPGHSAVVGEYIIRERLLPSDPDIVVLGFNANNAFRFALVPDVARFHRFEFRKFLFSSRLIHVLAAHLANRQPAKGHPRDRAGLNAEPLAELFRVASVAEFDSAIRKSVQDVRRAGAEPVFLILPRSHQVSNQFKGEDAASNNRKQPLAPRSPTQEFNPKELALLESSCLDHKTLDDPIGALRGNIDRWQPVYPQDEQLRTLLASGARAYLDSDWDGAVKLFRDAVEGYPDSPLAHYDLGVALLRTTDPMAGLEEFHESERLACSVFLRYQVALHRIALKLGVQVIDVMINFQAHDGEELFLDPAHPNVRGSELIAEALWSGLYASTPRK